MRGSRLKPSLFLYLFLLVYRRHSYKILGWCNFSCHVINTQNNLRINTDKTFEENKNKYNISSQNSSYSMHYFSYILVHLKAWYYIICYITLCYVILRYVRFCYVTLSCIVLYHTTPYYTTLYHIITYHIISYHIISYHIISYIISHRIITYRIISYNNTGNNWTHCVNSK